jgi:hypothetical protein
MAGKERRLVRSRRGRARGAAAQVIGDWTPAPTVACVSACKAAGYAREGLPLCDSDRMRLHGRRSARNGAGRGHDKARVQVKVSVAVGKLLTGGRGESAGGRHASCGRA